MGKNQDPGSGINIPDAGSWMGKNQDPASGMFIPDPDFYPTLSKSKNSDNRQFYYIPYGIHVF
jgi:hypothetical protein